MNLQQEKSSFKAIQEHRLSMALQKNDYLSFKFLMKKDKNFFKKILYHPNPQFLQIFFDNYHKSHVIYRKFSKEDITHLIDRIDKKEIRIQAINFGKLIVRQDFNNLQLFDKLKVQQDLWKHLPNLIDTFLKLNKEPYFLKNSHHYMEYFLKNGSFLSDNNILALNWHGDATKFQELLNNFPDLTKKKNQINEKIFNSVFYFCQRFASVGFDYEKFDIVRVNKIIKALDLTQEQVIHKIKEHAKDIYEDNVFYNYPFVLALIKGEKIKWEEKIKFKEEKTVFYYFCKNYKKIPEHIKNEFLLFENINNISIVKNDLMELKENKAIDQQNYDFIVARLENKIIKLAEKNENNYKKKFLL